MKNGNVDVVICPPCGEQPLAPEGFNPGVALATKRGANEVSPILPLLPRLTAVLPPQGREITTRGFTLIELLVVVLIIGILAAVAVPQYQKAVERSRVTQALALLKTTFYAAERYYLANGTWPQKFEELDIEIPWTGETKYSPNATDARSDENWSLELYETLGGTRRRVDIGRISGPYAGTGFVIWKESDTNPPTLQILCGIRSSVFDGTPEDYCHKVLGWEPDAGGNYRISY
ncbi:MAG: prepilin-type N-terminal cleavage/methylation domain-containing protein [Elusimicrobiaceae bacterium]|nr:prepilin-type N-terminal cleavage/methylation domain-containing protein [Elusimicrobiaceae bacterium]